jgi:hypothetical protein
MRLPWEFDEFILSGVKAFKGVRPAKMDMAGMVYGNVGFDPH